MTTVQADHLPHILVIDDNREILSTLDIILQRKSYRVSTKERLDDVLKSIRDIKPDLILLDKSLGWADGCDVCRQIKSDTELAHTPVIIFSAYYKKRDECIAAGADGFVEKPFAIHDLLNAIAVCLA